MAEKLSKRDIQNLDTVPYEKIRPFLKTGQIVFCSGSYLFSGVIQKLTRSVWSHVAIIYKDEELGRVLILEAEPYIGIRLIPLSTYLRDYKGKRRPYKGQMVIAGFNGELAENAHRNIIGFGLDELTRPYDNWEIIRILLRILFKVGKREKNRNYICSELVRDCFKRGGYVFQMKDSYISPQEIWEDDQVCLKYRVL